MTTAIEFFAQGQPKGQPRARAFAFNGRARMYDPGTAEGWKSQVAAAAKEHLPEQPLQGPLSLALYFAMPRPKSHYRTGKRSHELRDGAPYWHTGKPDADNLAKAVMDALTQLGVWKDDDQVCKLRIWKRYADDGKTGCLVAISEALQ